MAAQLCREVLDANFGDKRLNQRLVTVVEELGGKPNLSIPAATDERAEMEGAYRFFDNDKVTAEKIGEPHVAATLEPIVGCDVAVLVQDTTELVHRVEFKEPGRWTVKFALERFIIRSWPSPWTAYRWEQFGRKHGDEIETSLTKEEKAKKRKVTPIEQKESSHWIEGQRAARDVATDCPNTQRVCDSESESDIYELFVEPRTIGKPTTNSAPTESGAKTEPIDRQLELVVRECQKRSTTTGNWLGDVRDTDALFADSLPVSARVAKFQTAKVKKSVRSKSRDSRTANVEVRSRTVTVNPPPRHDLKMPQVLVNLVLVEELSPPENCDAIRWLLVTTLPVTTIDDD